MMCDRCGQPIQPGEKTITRDVQTNSGPGMTVRLHERLCERPPTRTYPSKR